MTLHRVEPDQRLDHALCVACAATRPDRTALADEEEFITFAELGADSDVAANQLTAAELERLMERTGARLLFNLRPDIAVADNIAGDASVPTHGKHNDDACWYSLRARGRFPIVAWLSNGWIWSEYRHSNVSFLAGRMSGGGRFKSFGVDEIWHCLPDLV
jgi:hypothetical protein